MWRYLKECRRFKFGIWLFTQKKSAEKNKL